MIKCPECGRYRDVSKRGEHIVYDSPRKQITVRMHFCSRCNCLFEGEREQHPEK